MKTNNKPHHPQCPAVDGFGCRCDELYSNDHYWPFPTKDNPLTPWTKEQEKKYMDEQRAKVPDSPM